jgi:glycosyltransferase involved in cell wall biosynthesis
VAYAFPPVAGSGVFRPLRLAKYLPRLGWSVTVLTVSARVRAIRDPALLREVPDGVDVVRTPSLEPRNALLAANRLGLGGWARRIEPWLMLPDAQRGWVPFARLGARRLLRERPHDVLVTTAGPYSAHLVGLAIKERSGIPWVADFRDEWTTNPYLRDAYPSERYRRYNEALERRVLESCDVVSCVSGPWLDALHARVPSIDRERFVVLPNGYDGEHLPEAPFPPPDRFRVVYAGTFYGHRSPGVFLEAVRRVVRSGAVPRDDLEVVFVGQRGSGGAPAADLEGSGVLRILGHRSYFESLHYLREAAVLLLVIPREGGAGNHTGKLFNYLASGRPILACAPVPNVAAELIHASASGVVVPPDDPAAIAAALANLHADWRARRRSRQDRAKLAPYEAWGQARAGAALLDDLATRSGKRAGGVEPPPGSSRVAHECRQDPDEPRRHHVERVVGDDGAPSGVADP